MSGAEEPVLWHIPISHFNEKARWALAWKGVEHERRAPPPGFHMLVALWHTRGAEKTLPMLRLDGEVIGDSSAIIAALEQRYPEPALYPADPALQARALELEEFFDERLGPQIRLAAWHEITRDRSDGGLDAMMSGYLPARLRASPVASAAVRRAASLYLRTRFRTGDEARVAQARRDIVAALDRLEQELGDGEYLVGDRFTVADLTAASLFYPLASPPEGPKTPAVEPERLREYFEPLRKRRGIRWVAEMFARHRNPAPSA